MNEFVKPIRDHFTVEGTELENDANVVHALVRFKAVLLWNLHRCTEDSGFALAFLGVSSAVRVPAQIRTISNTNRFGFAALGNFYVEWMLRDLVSRFGGSPANGFYLLAKQAAN